ncbi:MAG TPA: UPF0175 family protein [Candidatus Acidoferrum sp.]|jgi:predicted HTH domain antitoxin
MEVTVRIPDEIARRLPADREVSRQILEAFAAEAYRDNSLTLLDVSELLGLGRVETEDFLGRHGVPLSDLTEADLDREAALFDAAAQRKNR